MGGRHCAEQARRGSRQRHACLQEGGLEQNPQLLLPLKRAAAAAVAGESAQGCERAYVGPSWRPRQGHPPLDAAAAAAAVATRTPLRAVRCEREAPLSPRQTRVQLPEVCD
jgi:hypothetical protein